MAHGRERRRAERESEDEELHCAIWSEKQLAAEVSPRTLSRKGQSDVNMSGMNPTTTNPLHQNEAAPCEAATAGAPYVKT